MGDEERGADGWPIAFAVIYDHPRDFPHAWVMRVQHTHKDGSIEKAPAALVCRTLAAAEGFVRRRWPHAVRVQGPGDDPDPVIHSAYLL